MEPVGEGSQHRGVDIREDEGDLTAGTDTGQDRLEEGTDTVQDYFVRQEP